MNQAERRIRFPISRLACERYSISPELLRSESSSALVLTIARTDSESSGDEISPLIVSAGELDATLLLSTLLSEELRRLGRPDEEDLRRLERELGREGLATLLEAFLREFAVHDVDEPGADLEDPSWLLRFLVLVFWLNHNPATASMRRLFDDRGLAQKAPYRQAIDLLLGGSSSGEAPGIADRPDGNTSLGAIESVLDSEPESGLAERAATMEVDLRYHLETPIHASPRSLAGQIETVIERWAEGRVDEATLRVLDLLAEEEPRFPHDPGHDDGRTHDLVEPLASTPAGAEDSVASDPLPMQGFAGAPAGGWQRRARSMTVHRRTAPDSLRTRPESDWMRQLVLQAKHAHVWLDQLSKRLGEPVERLDRIPVAELDRLVEDGATALWLIGVWERSAASRMIKRRTGGSTAAASAYSIHDYRIAADLGGEEAMDELLDRAQSCGLRIAVDVVPNHVGIDSTWVHQHPEWLLSVDDCPFPGYDFDTPDLSSDPDVGLFLERGYQDRSDAAVVFRRLDRRTGEQRFVYHGNDGTGLPWNDTAQIDYTNPAARRAVSDLILEQARRFPILRFDAAMTLTRLHYQRLWFPQPGDGGAIPSRSRFGMTIERFEERVHEEFWRQVVERVEGEGLDTLLIAEAFWLMEPYFVRDLGMHRVYNSSFMHLLRRRDTRRLRQLLEQTVATDPAMVRHSVYYATNPDEQPAVVQFGRGDRYFGVMSLLALIPATPLLGHGQIEGLSEKYGMEYLHALSDEGVDQPMIERHRREIVPLLRRRGSFEPDDLEILRLVDGSGESPDDVLAILRGSGSTAVIVVFNHAQHPVRGALLPGPDLSGLNPLIDRVEDPAELEWLEQEEIAAAEARWLAQRPADGSMLAERLTAILTAAPTLFVPSGIPLESPDDVSLDASEDEPLAATDQPVDPLEGQQRLVWHEERSGAARQIGLDELAHRGLPVELGPEQTIVLSGFRVEKVDQGAQ